LEYLKENVVRTRSHGSNNKYSNLTIEFKIKHKEKEYPIEWASVIVNNKNES